MNTIKTTIYVLRLVDDYGPAYAVASGLQVTNVHPCITHARMFQTREAAEYFITLQAAHYQRALKVIEFNATFTENEKGSN